jgi:hypothetical protein
MLILLRLVRDLLMGAFRVYDLNQTKDSYLIDKINLQQQILEILSNKNNAYVDLVGGTGQLSVTKSFKLAPVYNYYISIFGMPQNRAGFDPVKLKYLDDILTKKGITP